MIRGIVWVMEKDVNIAQYFAATPFGIAGWAECFWAVHTISPGRNPYFLPLAHEPDEVPLNYIQLPTPTQSAKAKILRRFRRFPYECEAAHYFPC